MYSYGDGRETDTQPWFQAEGSPISVEMVATDQMIEPWIKEQIETPTFNDVPSYIKDIAKQVIVHYDFQENGMTIITTNPRKGAAVWKVETDKGPKVLKALHRKPTKNLFSIGAQKHLVKQGANVPGIVPTKTGKDCVEAGGKLWVVTEWIDLLTPLAQDLEEAKMLVSALGEFHKLSRGYLPPKGVETPSKLFKWPKEYQKMITKFDWFRNISKLYQEFPASSAILAVIDQYEQEAHKALSRLELSSYHDLCLWGEPNWGLVHQDYGWNNAQMGPDRVWMINLDEVSYDIPARDLRMFITNNMAKSGWNKEWIREILKAYHQTNPIESSVYEIFLIDMAFPYEFYDLVKNMVYDPKTFLNEELKTSIYNLQQAEANKLKILLELENEWKEGGNHESINDLYRDASCTQYTRRSHSNLH